MSEVRPNTQMAGEHQGLLKGLRSVYTLLLEMGYLQEGEVSFSLHPDLPVEQIRTAGKSLAAIALIENMPMLSIAVDQMGDYVDLAPVSSGLSYFYRFDIEVARDVDWPSEAMLPSTAIKILWNAHVTLGHVVVYDMTTKEIIEWDVDGYTECRDWDTARRLPVPEYFEAWTRKLCNLDWMPWRGPENSILEPRAFYARYLEQPDGFKEWVESFGGSIEAFQSEQNAFGSKRLVYEHAGWPDQFDRNRFRQKWQSCRNQYMEVLFRVEPSGRSADDVENGRELREWFRQMAGRLAV